MVRRNETLRIVVLVVPHACILACYPPAYAPLSLAKYIISNGMPYREPLAPGGLRQFLD